MISPGTTLNFRIQCPRNAPRPHPANNVGDLGIIRIDEVALIGVARLFDAPVAWSRQHQIFGLEPLRRSASSIVMYNCLFVCWLEPPRSCANSPSWRNRNSFCFFAALASETPDSAVSEHRPKPARQPLTYRVGSSYAVTRALRTFRHQAWRSFRRLSDMSRVGGM
jgi:hypothetical protein